MSITDIIIAVMIRAAAPGDLARIQDICRETLDLEPDANRLPAILAAAPGRLSVVADKGGRVAGTCTGSLRQQPGKPVRGYLDLLAVAPSAAGHGAGRALLSAMEGLLAERGAAELIIGGHPPVYLWPGVDVRYTTMTCLASSAGYQRHSDATDLAVSLDTADLRGEAELASLAAAGVTLRRARRAESGSLVAWLRAGPWGDSSWPDEVAAALDNEPPGCHVACRDGRYAGFACHGSVRAGWFGPMGTLPGDRGLGIGAALLRRCLTDMSAAGLRTAMIGWAGPVKFYVRAVGARVGRVYWLYRKDLGGEAADAR